MKYATKVLFKPDLPYIGRATVVLGEHAKSSVDADAVLTHFFYAIQSF